MFFYLSTCGNALLLWAYCFTFGIEVLGKSKERDNVVAGIHRRWKDILEGNGIMAFMIDNDVARMDE